MNSRNNIWLEYRLVSLINNFFPDIELKNHLSIRFGKRGRRQLGCIAKKHSLSLIGRLKNEFESEIRINGLFRDTTIPEFVIDGTIIHELCHYAHGFSSPLPQQSKYPHQGGVVKAEMIKRGAGDIYLAERKWLKQNWQNYLQQHYKI